MGGRQDLPAIENGLRRITRAKVSRYTLFSEAWPRLGSPQKSRFGWMAMDSRASPAAKRNLCNRTFCGQAVGIPAHALPDSMQLSENSFKFLISVTKTWRCKYVTPAVVLCPSG
jgi:hypothetical protein